MPSQPTRPSSGAATGTKVVKAMNALSPLQKKVFFSIGATLAFLVLAQYAKVEIITPHDHASAFQVGAEYGGRVALLIIAIAFMVPPFGMWFVAHIPLPGFLKRKSNS